MHERLIILLGISLVIVLVCKFVLKDIPNFLYFDDEIKDVLSSISLSFMAAYIFYIVDIWLPSKDKKEKVNARIAIPLSRILLNMKIPIEYTVNKNRTDKISISDITKSQLKNSIIGTDLLGESAPMVFSNSRRKANYMEYLIEHTSKVEKYVKQVYEFPTEIDVDLITILDRIRNSQYHESVESLKRFWRPGHQIAEDYFSNSFPEYLTLYKELYNYMEDNNIEVTIEEL